MQNSICDENDKMILISKYRFASSTNNGGSVQFRKSMVLQTSLKYFPRQSLKRFTCRVKLSDSIFLSDLKSTIHLNTHIFFIMVCFSNP